MKTNHLLKNFQTELKRNHNQYLLVTLALFIGIFLGSMTAVVMKEANAEILHQYIDQFFSAYSLQSVAKSEVFKLSLTGNIKTALIIWVSSFSVFLIPVSIVHMSSKGFSIGFSIAFLIKQFGFRGLLFGVISILPNNLILLPAVIIYTVFSINFALELRRQKQWSGPNKMKRQMYFGSLSALLIFTLVIVLCSLLEGFILPTLIRPLCSLFMG